MNVVTVLLRTSLYTVCPKKPSILILRSKKLYFNVIGPLKNIIVHVDTLYIAKCNAFMDI